MTPMADRLAVGWIAVAVAARWTAKHVALAAGRHVSRRPAQRP
jgi:hypothetical protein